MCVTYKNWRDVQRKNVVNNVDMPSLRATKWLVQKQTHRTTQTHAEHQDAAYITMAKS